MNQQFYRNMALWVVILVMILLLVTMLRQGQTAPPELAYSEFLEKVEIEQVESVTIEENHIHGRLTDGSDFGTYTPAVTDELLALLQERNVRISARPKPGGRPFVRTTRNPLSHLPRPAPQIPSTRAK